jgi:preprotein translocase subunit SecA
VLEYDDVMNQQREVVYEYRDRILEGEDMSETAREQISDVVERMAREYMEGDYVEDWDLDGLFTQLEQIYPCSYSLEDIDPQAVDRESLIQDLRTDVVEAYDEREQELGAELMRTLERFMLLQIIDERWREHLHDMDYLREGIHLRGFAQIDPLVAYKNEGFDMFRELMNNIWDEFARYVFNVEVAAEGDGATRQQPTGWAMGGNSSSTSAYNYAGGHAAAGREAIAAAAGQAGAAAVPAEMAEAAGYAAEATAEPPPQVETRRLEESEKVGRNDPCWCGSGKKFKKCHGA